jgi:hypothetical protein
MKLILSLFILFSLIFNPSADNSESDFKPNIFQINDLSVFDLSKSIKISLGMKKEEVENKLGNPIDTIDFMRLNIYDGVEVHYKNGVVNGLIIRDTTNDNTRFSTARGLKYGDNIKDFIMKYGDNGKKDESSSNISFTYLLEDEGNDFKTLDSFMGIKDTAKIYTISMNFYDKEIMSFIMIADYDFTINPTQS